MDQNERERRRQGADDEIDETLRPGEERAEPDQARQQDFATRGAMMSNAIPGGSAPVAGAVIGSGGELGMEPTTDEEKVEAEEEATGRPRQAER